MYFGPGRPTRHELVDEFRDGPTDEASLPVLRKDGSHHA